MRIVAYIARGIALAGLVLAFVSEFLTWIEADGNQSLWDITERFDIVMAVALGVAAGLVALSFFLLPRLLLLLSLPLPAFVLGQVLPVESFEFIESGQWLAITGAVLALGGALLAAIALLPVREDDRVDRVDRDHRPPAAARPSGPVAEARVAPERAQETVAGRPAPPPPAAPPATPAGWYPDPLERARLRYWAGDRWTDDTRE